MGKRLESIINRHGNLLEVHAAVLLFGLAGLFGKLVALPSIIIVLGRTIFASLFLLIFLKSMKQSIKLRSKRHYLYFSFLGLILAAHWVTFFQSIQMSTVAIGLLTFSTFPVFVTFMEPIFFKESIRLRDVITACAAFIGVAMVVPEYTIKSSITQGAVFGILSGFTFAILSILNKKVIREYSSLIIAFYEDLTAAIALLPFIFFYNIYMNISDMLLIILLGIVFTGISHSLFIKSLKGIKAQTASIISCLEPVYGIVFSCLLLGEIPDARTLLGGSIILGTVFYSSIRHS